MITFPAFPLIAIAFLQFFRILTHSSSFQLCSTHCLSPPTPELVNQEYYKILQSTKKKSKLVTFIRTASAGGIASNMLPPTYLRFPLLFRSATTCGWSNTMHSMWGNVLAMAPARVPVPPPTSTNVFNPSNTSLHLWINALDVNRVSLAMPSLKKWLSLVSRTT